MTAKSKTFHWRECQSCQVRSDTATKPGDAALLAAVFGWHIDGPDSICPSCRTDQEPRP